MTSTLRICLGSSCFARGNRDLVALAQDFCAKHSELQIELAGCLCAGRCLRGPVIELDGVVHEQVDGPALQRILAEQVSPA